MRSRDVTAWALVIVAVAVVSCGLFETRNPAKPIGNQFNCLTLTTPVNVYTNIVLAYGKPEGLGCYLSTLADSTSPTSIGFRFHPDPADSLNFVNQFASWGKGIEERVAQNIANADSLKLTFDPNFVPVTSQPDVEIRQYAYQITFKATGSGAIPDTFFQGLAEIRLDRATGGQWSVTDWVDRRDPNGTTTRTWGYLRGSYRTGF